MAGIGFELKKLLNKKNILSTIGGYFYATFVSVGPILIVVLMMLIIRIIMRRSASSVVDQNIILCSIMYSFMFGLLASSIVTMVMSRYVSDIIYIQKEDKILPALIGSLSLVIVIAGSISSLFYTFRGKLDIVIELLCHLFAVILAIMYVIMIFVSALKDYKRISFSFLFGSIVGIVTALVFVYLTDMYIVYAILGSLVIGFFIIAVLLLYNVCIHFKQNDESYFEFYGHFKKYPRLVPINLLYILTIFAHNIFVWCTDIGMEVMKTYICCPIYDVPAFMALMSVLPTTVIFVTRTETSFFELYKEYIHTLSGSGTLKDLRYAGENMRINMYEILISLFQEQLLITCLSIVIARYCFPLIGLADVAFTFFSYLAIAYFCIITVNVISTIILYFDDRKSSMRTIGVFFVLVILGSYISTLFDVRLYGLGTAIGGIISLIFAFIFLNKMMQDLDYRLYCSQPIHDENGAES